jgi:hypothetical protein
MDNTICIDLSELRENSKFSLCSAAKMPNLHPLPNLEGRTGADLMICPLGLPYPANDFLLQRNIDEGALLVQMKFGLDLMVSIIDGRYKAGQERMITTKAKPDQIILLFIGSVFEAKTDNELMINGQRVSDIIPAAKSFTYSHYWTQRLLWAMRGGIFEQVVMDYKIIEWIKSAAKAIQECQDRPIRKVWQPRQSLFLVDDWRNMMINLPDIGEKKAQDIYEWLEDKSFYGFMDALQNDSLQKVDGIGKKTVEKIKHYLEGK